MAKKDVKVIKFAIIAAIVSVGGWSIFEGITKMFNLEGVSAFTNIVIGIIIVWLSFKFGLNKIK